MCFMAVEDIAGGAACRVDSATVREFWFFVVSNLALRLNLRDQRCVF